MAATDPGGLASRTCVPCRGGVPPLPEEEVRILLRELHADWRVVEGKRLEREFRFKNFRGAMSFAQAVGAIAEGRSTTPTCASDGAMSASPSLHMQ